MQVNTTDLRKGLKVEIDEKPYLVIKCDFTNPGKGAAFYKVKFKNMISGLLLERTYKSGVSTGIKFANITEKTAQYMYSDPSTYHFLDQETYETIEISHEGIGEDALYFQDEIILKLLYFNDSPISVELPIFVNLKVADTDPGLKGDTASGGLKKATMSTGLSINIPLFVQIDEVIKIDTRTGKYVERVKS